VAAALGAYLAGVEERARRAEVERARAETRAAGERKLRRVQVGLAASLLVLVGVGGGGGGWGPRREAEARGEAARRAGGPPPRAGEALQEAKVRHDQARASVRDRKAWAAGLAGARAAVRRAEQVLTDDPADEELAGQARALAGELQAAERQHRLVEQLE